MRYEVITDEDGYVQYIRHTGTSRDFVELDLDDYDFTYDRIYAYKLGKDELVFDTDKYKKICAQNLKKEDEEEIRRLKKELADTDYIITK